MTTLGEVLDDQSWWISRFRPNIVPNIIGKVVLNIIVNKLENLIVHIEFYITPLDTMSHDCFCSRFHRQ